MKFNLDGITVNLQISGYKKSSLAGRFDEWCDISFSLQSDYLSYEQRGAFLLCQELEELYEKMTDLIEGRMTAREHMFFAEPVMEFRLRPALHDEDSESDIDMYLIINFADDEGVVTANNIQILFGREAVEQLHAYLTDVISKGTGRKKVYYDFEYYIGYNDGTCSRVRPWREEVYEDEAKIVEACLKKGLHFSQMEGLDDLKERLEGRIKTIEADNLRDAEIWTEEYFNEYGTDDPFKVFELVIDIKDR